LDNEDQIVRYGRTQKIRFGEKPQEPEYQVWKMSPRTRIPGMGDVPPRTRIPGMDEVFQEATFQRSSSRTHQE